MDGIFLGRQPILDRSQNLVAFELLFRLEQSATTAEIDNDLSATANVIVNAYGQLGIQNVLDQQRGFINVDAELLVSDAICLLPSKHVVLEILEKVVENVNDEIVGRCIELKNTGYQLALDDVTEVNAKTERLLPFVSIVKVDVSRLNEETLVNLVEKLKQWPVILLAEKVESHEQAAQCMELGFEMFQGFFYAKPEVISGKRADPAKMSLLKLLTMVMGDSEVEELEKEFKLQPGLSYNLMRMVNSVSSGAPKKLNSIKQAIMVLGRLQLQRWIQLLLYTANQSGESMSNALMQTAAARGKFMELVAQADRPHDKNYHERAFMVGILSLLDTLLGIEMQQIIDNLGIPEEMGAALLVREGRLGLELKLAEANEAGNMDDAQAILDELNFLSLDELTQAELEALSWANRVGEMAN